MTIPAVKIRFRDQPRQRLGMFDLLPHYDSHFRDVSRNTLTLLPSRKPIDHSAERRKIPTPRLIINTGRFDRTSEPIPPIERIVLNGNRIGEVLDNAQPIEENRIPIYCTPEEESLPFVDLVASHLPVFRRMFTDYRRNLFSTLHNNGFCSINSYARGLRKTSSRLSALWQTVKGLSRRRVVHERLDGLEDLTEVLSEISDANLEIGMDTKVSTPAIILPDRYFGDSPSTIRAFADLTTNRKNGLPAHLRRTFERRGPPANITHEVYTQRVPLEFVDTTDARVDVTRPIEEHYITMRWSPTLRGTLHAPTTVEVFYRLSERGPGGGAVCGTDATTPIQVYIREIELNRKEPRIAA